MPLQNEREDQRRNRSEKKSSQEVFFGEIGGVLRGNTIRGKRTESL